MASDNLYKSESPQSSMIETQPTLGTTGEEASSTIIRVENKEGIFTNRIPNSEGKIQTLFNTFGAIRVFSTFGESQI